MTIERRTGRADGLALGEGDALADGEGLADGDGDALGEGDADGEGGRWRGGSGSGSVTRLGLGDGEGLGLGDGLGVGDGVGLGVGLGVGEGVGLGVGEGVGVGVGVGVAVGSGVGEGVGCGVGLGDALGLGLGVSQAIVPEIVRSAIAVRCSTAEATRRWIWSGSAPAGTAVEPSNPMRAGRPTALGAPDGTGRERSGEGRQGRDRGKRCTGGTGTPRADRRPGNVRRAAVIAGLDVDEDRVAALDEGVLLRRDQVPAGRVLDQEIERPGVAVVPGEALGEGGLGRVAVLVDRAEEIRG